MTTIRQEIQEFHDQTRTAAKELNEAEYLIAIKSDWFAASLELQQAQRRLAQTAARLDDLVNQLAEVRA